MDEVSQARLTILAAEHGLDRYPLEWLVEHPEQPAWLEIGRSPGDDTDPINFLSAGIIVSTHQAGLRLFADLCSLVLWLDLVPPPVPGSDYLDLSDPFNDSELRLGTSRLLLVMAERLYESAPEPDSDYDRVLDTGSSHVEDPDRRAWTCAWPVAIAAFAFVLTNSIDDYLRRRHSGDDGSATLFRRSLDRAIDSLKALFGGSDWSS